VVPVRDAPATAVSLNDTSVSAQIRGVIKDIPVRVGDTVEKEETVAELACEDYELVRRQAKASLEVARARNKFAKYQERRAIKLLKSKSISEETMQERSAEASAAGAEVAQLTAALQAAESDVEKCTIRAPFRAVVVERIASAGEFAAPGAVIVRLLDQDNIEISAMVQEQDLPSLKEASSMRFLSRDRAYPLKLRIVLPLMESRLRSYEVRLTFEGEKAPPGSAGRLAWVPTARQLPSEYVVERDNKLGVFVARGDKAHFQVLPGAKEGQPVSVSLPDDTMVILDGRFSLEDGDFLEIVQR
jgi:RND family efflux transporter MFP subunit